MPATFPAALTAPSASWADAPARSTTAKSGGTPGAGRVRPAWISYAVTSLPAAKANGPGVPATRARTRTPRGRGAADRRRESRRPEPAKIRDRALAPGHDDEIGRAELGRRRDPAHADPGLLGERLEVVEVREAREPDDRDLDRHALAARGLARRVEIERILGGRQPAGDPRHDPEHGHARARGQLLEPRTEHRHVAAEPVHDEAAHARAVGRIEERERAHECSEHAAAVDVADEQDARVGEPGDAHVHDLGRREVDLGGTPCAFDDDEVVGAPETRQALADDR